MISIRKEGSADFYTTPECNILIANAMGNISRKYLASYRRLDYKSRNFLVHQSTEID